MVFLGAAKRLALTGIGRTRGIGRNDVLASQTTGVDRQFSGFYPILAFSQPIIANFLPTDFQPRLDGRNLAACRLEFKFVAESQHDEQNKNRVVKQFKNFACFSRF
jgi:hypothetical protein